MDPKEVYNEYNEKYDKKLMIDHDYDGIKELDNPPPPWLMWLFYITIFFSVGYAAYYHWFGQGDLQAAEYENEMKEAAEMYKNAQAAGMDVNNLTLYTDEAALTAGADLYTKSCTACHGANGEGNAVGPNLCDEYWITGNTPKDVFSIIKNGNANGMTAFQQFSDEQILQLTSFILTKLKGTNPENAKEPQGEKM